MKVLIAGDFAPVARLAEQIENRKFSEIFQGRLRKIIKSADFSFVNFESPIVEDSFQPIPKCGPNLRCTPEAAEAIKFAGFTGVTMANNHILDYGPEGLHKSVECCKSQGLDVVGVGDNLVEAQKVLYLDNDGRRLAVINCCEHEFSIATETSAGANPLNPIRQYYEIQEAKKNADFVLVIVHGGHEYYQLPSIRMQETYRFFVDAGADAVVNHHQHCFSGYELYHGKPIFYGLGNFCFDIQPTRTNTLWNFGYLLELQFDDEIYYRTLPYNQYGDSPTIDMLDGASLFDQITQLNSIIIDKGSLSKKNEEYFDSCKGFECSILEPYSGRFWSKLYSMHFLPSFIRGDKVSRILNHINCESHRDKLIYTLKRKIK